MIGAFVLSITLAFFLSSCSDEEKFTTDRGAILSFSTDTVSFDTLFTGISSSTERLCAYNRNSSGVRISNVRLSSGGQSGFKMNVDGEYGTSIDNVEILKKDSIFIFVEVNAPEQNSVEPTKVEDDIIFTLESGIEQKVSLIAYGQDVHILKAQTINGNETLNATLPYLIYDSLVVAQGSTLTLEQGTTLCFHNGAQLIVHGKLNIDGTMEKPVTLRGDRTDRLLTNLPYDRLDNQWGGIYLSPSCTGSAISYADIHGSNYGIISDSISGEITIENSIIHNVGGDGLYLLDSKALVVNSQFSNARGNCIAILGSTASFYHCTVAQFCPWTADRGNALIVNDYEEEDIPHLASAKFYNCFVTGYDDDEVYGTPIGETLDLNFYNCVLLTDISDTTYFHNCTAEDKDLDRYQSTNFHIFDTDAYYYDFRLDSLSTARRKGSPEYSKLCPADRNGLPRGESPDAGCYQYK